MIYLFICSSFNIFWFRDVPIRSEFTVNDAIHMFWCLFTFLESRLAREMVVNFVSWTHQLNIGHFENENSEDSKNKIERKKEKEKFNTALCVSHYYCEYPPVRIQCFHYRITLYAMASTILLIRYTVELRSMYTV